MRSTRAAAKAECADPGMSHVCADPETEKNHRPIIYAIRLPETGDHITHRPALAEIADQVVNLKDGKNGRAGDRLTVAVPRGVIDSGGERSASHILGVSRRVTIGEQIDENVYIDLMGHGTAVSWRPSRKSACR